MSRLVRAVVKNLKGVDYIEIVFDDITDIAGDEGEGKSSFIDGVLWAFEGTRPIQDMPIRDGEMAAYTLLETDDVIITREYTKDDTKPNGYRTTLKIKGQMGGTFNQTDLARMFPNLVDPSKFFEMDTKDVIKTLLSFLSKEEQHKLAVIDEQLGDLEEERLACSRNLKKTGVPEEVEEVKAVSLSVLNVQRDEILAYNQKQDNLQQRANDHLNFIDIQKEKVQVAEEEIERMETLLDTEEQKLKDLEKLVLESATERESTNKVDGEIANAEETNAKAATYQDYLRRKADRIQIEADHDKAEASILKLREQKKDIMTNAELPGDDLVEIVDNKVFVRGRPIEQLSTSEKIVFSAEMAMASNPSPDAGRIRTLIIRRGESLGKKTYKKVCDLREKYDYQLLIESVGKGHSPNAIILEEGKIKGKDDE